MVGWAAVRFGASAGRSVWWSAHVVMSSRLSLWFRSMSFGLIPGVVRESLCRDPRLASPGGHEPRPGMRVGVWFLLQRENLLLIGRAGPPHRLPPLGIPSAARPRRTRGPAWAPSEVGGDFDAPAFLRCSDPAHPRHQDEGGASGAPNLLTSMGGVPLSAARGVTPHAPSPVPPQRQL